MMPPRLRAAVFSLVPWLPVALLRAADAPAPAVVLHSLDEPDPARDARIAWHTDARFGCFVHWGVYSALGNEFEGRKGGGYAEHIMRVLKIPRATYLEKVAKPFNPEKFDADAWVRLMRDAGMRYLIITAKHHDGFAMWPSKVSGYNPSPNPNATRWPSSPPRAKNTGSSSGSITRTPSTGSTPTRPATTGITTILAVTRTATIRIGGAVAGRISFRARSAT